MDKDELKERIAEHLRSLDIDESGSVESIAEAIGEPLSDVNMAVDAMLTERLLYQDGKIGKRTYSLTSKGKHWKAPGKAEIKEAEDKPEVKRKTPQPPTGASPEERPEAEDPRMCRWCRSKLCSKAYRIKHEPGCPSNPVNRKVDKQKPDEALVDAGKDEGEHEPVEGDQQDRPAEAPPSHEHTTDLPVFHPSKERCYRCEHSVAEVLPGGTVNYICCGSHPDMTEAECKARHKFVPPMATAEEVREAESILQDLRDNDTRTADRLEHMRRLCDDVLAAHPEPNTDEITASRDDEVISMTATPGTSTVLRLLSACQMAVRDGADISLDAHVKLAEGYYVNIRLDTPTDAKEAPTCP